MQMNSDICIALKTEYMSCLEPTEIAINHQEIGTSIGGNMTWVLLRLILSSLD